MDVDDDIDTNATEFPLNDLPNEVLILVMSHLNATSLLDMTLVSTRFRALAKEAFPKKYNGETKATFFDLRIFCENEIEEHRKYHPYFQTFGDNMPAIKIEFYFYPSDVSRDHWLYHTIRNYCTALTKVYISQGGDFNLSGILSEQTARMLTHLSFEGVRRLVQSWNERVYPKLKSFHVSFVEFGSNELNTLFSHNPQITDLKLSLTNFEFGSLAQLHNLSSIHLQGRETDFGSDRIQLNSVQSCVLKYSSPLPALERIHQSCRNLKKLAVYGCSELDRNGTHADCIRIICTFMGLEYLGLYAPSLTEVDLANINESLPNLKSIHLQATDWLPIPKILDLCTHLTSLKLNRFFYKSQDHQETFCREMVGLTHHNKSLEVTICSRNDYITFTQGRIRSYLEGPGFSALKRWMNIESFRPETGFNLLGLDDKCLGQIVGILDDDSQIALFNTCQRTQKVVKDHLAEHMFHLKGKVDVDDLRNVAEYVHRMNYRTYPSSDVAVQSVSWPNLRVLILSTPVFCKTSFQLLESFKSPTLTQLEILNMEGIKPDNHINISMSLRMLNQDGVYRNLTSLKFGHYSTGVEMFLSCLGDAVCEQMQKLSLSNISLSSNNNREWHHIDRTDVQEQRKNLKLVNILMRFRNLTSLHLLFPGVEYWDLKCLFEKCSKVTDLAICFNGEFDHDEQTIFEVIKENCCRLRNIRLVRHPDWEMHDLFEGDVHDIRHLLRGISIELTYLMYDLVLATYPVEFANERRSRSVFNAIRL